ncbi:Similar to hypothetical protein PIIN_06528 [Piriformospora indica DSM 11827]; acc. no. CCA72591 [Pyronema omphalodes CBS 100304]|uniref:G domain-containing protein n=1 Tax=Pyronema omphalodes (strain CBS 100304) TaxID=1076935 RepID=U4L7V6_PYROM|nr:Similar to hypothetical protein PIIN_06528 [Piriformospora indica DSM 11827]; acc. no. CCA72591 [Pyronema omphalodes CBS 100304]
MFADEKFRHTGIEDVSYTHNGKKLVFVDTPGFNDTNKPDSMILEQVARWLDITYRKGKHLAGIIYLHRITDNRMDVTSSRNLRMFKKLCGPDALKNVCLTTTHWDMVDQRKGRSREVELQGKFWQEMIKHGARTARFDGRAEAAWRVVEPMMNNQTVVLQIQEEMGRQHMKLSDTDAGKTVSKELAKADKEFQEEIAALRKEWQSAVQEKDREVAKVLESERRRAEERLAQTQKERDQFIRMQYEGMKRSNEALLQKLERDNRQYGFLESLGMAFSALIPRFRSS